MNRLGVEWKHFDYKDRPARQLAANRFPEVYTPGKGWGPIKDTFDFLHSYVPITEERSQEMIRRLEGDDSPTGQDA